MSKKAFLVVIEKDEDGFLVGSVPGLPGCHTQAKTLPALLERMKEVVQLCLEENKSLAKDFSLDFVGVQKIEVNA